MEFDLSHVPFSRYGSCHSIRYIAASANGPGGLFLCHVPRGSAFQLELLEDGRAVPFTTRASPQQLELRSARGSVVVTFETDERLRFLARGVALRWSAGGGIFNYALPRGKDTWQLNMFNVNHSFLLTRLRGSVSVDAPWQITKAAHVIAVLDGRAGEADAAFEYFTTTAPSPIPAVPFEQVAARQPEGFAAFLDRLPLVPQPLAAARELAGYILWSAVIKPRGALHRTGMLMSKNHMTQIWSWDHCFNAMALAAGHPDLAWDQLMVMFDPQDSHGCLPDSLQPDNLCWNFCKPPIHGWALGRMLELNPALAARLPEIYEPLCRWTRWWLETRDDDGDGMPQYNHGNDSGWDNATCFDLVPPMEGPDLAAFLVTQMDALADVAGRLGRQDDAAAWRRKADAMQQTLLAHAWDGTRFRAKRSGTHETPAKGDSLIPFMPLLLGKRLPADIGRRLADGLREPGRFITEWGPATESPLSPLYEPDGYWRGPIWAPSTHLLVDGLLRGGETELARDIARRFCRLCAASGMAENFDALTGAPLRDKAYTWTASVFLLLAHEFVAHGE